MPTNEADELTCVKSGTDGSSCVALQLGERSWRSMVLVEVSVAGAAFQAGLQHPMYAAPGRLRSAPFPGPPAGVGD